MKQVPMTIRRIKLSENDNVLYDLAAGATTAPITGTSEYAIAGYIPIDPGAVTAGMTDLLVVQHQRGLSPSYWLSTIESWAYNPMDDGLLQFKVSQHPATITLMTALAPTQIYQVVRWLRPKNVNKQWIDAHAAHAALRFNETQHGYVAANYRWVDYYDMGDFNYIEFYTSDPIRNTSFQPVTSAVAAESHLPPIPGQSSSAQGQSGSGYVPSDTRMNTVASSTFWGSHDNQEEVDNV